MVLCRRIAKKNSGSPVAESSRSFEDKAELVAGAAHVNRAQLHRKAKRKHNQVITASASLRGESPGVESSRKDCPLHCSAPNQPTRIRRQGNLGSQPSASREGRGRSRSCFVGPTLANGLCARRGHGSATRGR